MTEDFKKNFSNGPVVGPDNEIGVNVSLPKPEPPTPHEPHDPLSPPEPHEPPVPPEPHEPEGPEPGGHIKPAHLIELNINSVRHEFSKGSVFSHSQLVQLAFVVVDPNKTYTITYWTVGQMSKTLDISQSLVLERRTFVNVACTHKS